MYKVQAITFTIQFLIVLGNIITYSIIARILISWFTMGKPGSRGRFSQIIYDVTEPPIAVARKLPHRLGMIDFSPLIALIGVDLLVSLIITLLAGLL